MPGLLQCLRHGGYNMSLACGLTVAGQYSTRVNSAGPVTSAGSRLVAQISRCLGSVPRFTSPYIRSLPAWLAARKTLSFLAAQPASGDSKLLAMVKPLKMLEVRGTDEGGRRREEAPLDRHVTLSRDSSRLGKDMAGLPLEQPAWMPLHRTSSPPGG